MSNVQSVEEAALAAAEAVRASHARAAAADAEEAKWNAKRTVTVTAIHGPRNPLDPNVSKHKHYWVPGHKIEIGGSLTDSFTERQIYEMKKDPFVSVDDPEDKEQQAAKAKSEAEAKAKALEEAKALVAQSAPAESHAASGVAPAAVEALQELKEQRKGKR